MRNVCDRLLNAYVLSDMGKRMSERLHQGLAAGQFDHITDPVAFADALTGEVQTVQHDGHLMLRYAPEDAADTMARDEVDPLARIRTANYGLRKVEVLPGNIGYIDIAHFWADTAQGRTTVKAAFQFVANTEALIIDLRTCGGGSQDAVRDMAGFFFAQPTHLNDMYDRMRNDTTHYWTRPDAAFVRFTTLPLYVLTGPLTFSAAEEFCYDLQARQRATIVGERTGGGAHGMDEVPVGHGMILSLPYCEAINPVTHTNWEGVGVLPEVQVEADAALGTAELLILDARLAAAKDDDERFDLSWERDFLTARNAPVQLPLDTLLAFAGVYGDRTFTVEQGHLYYKRTGRPKFEMEAMSPTMMKARDNTYFKIEFVRIAQSVPDRVIAYYQDGRVERSMRTR